MASTVVAGTQDTTLPNGRRRPVCTKCGTPRLGHSNGRKVDENGIVVCPPADEEDNKGGIISDVPLDLTTSYPSHLQARTYPSAPPSPDKVDSASVRGDKTPIKSPRDSSGRLRVRHTLPQDYVLDFQKRGWPAESPEHSTISQNDKLIGVLENVARHGGLYIMPYDLATVQITSVRDLAAKMGLFTRLETVPAAYVEDGKTMFVIVGDRKDEVLAKDVVDKYLRLWEKNDMPGSITRHRALEEKQVVLRSNPALVVDRFFNVLLFLSIVFCLGAAFEFYILASG